MNQARFNAIYSGLTSLEKKVYEAVPISDPWDIKQISNELNRCGSTPDPRVLGGCMSTLVDAGLVLETAPKVFVRVSVKPKPEKSPPHHQAPPATFEATNEIPPTVNALKQPAPKAASNQQDILEKMSALAGRVNHVRAYLEQLSSDIETTALEIEEQMAEREKDMAKLRQLQALLKDLTPA